MAKPAKPDDAQPPLSPERARLAEAIAERPALERESKQLAAAADPAWRAMLDAEEALQGARTAVDAAAHDAVTHRVQVLAGDLVSAAPPSVEQARRELREAEDTLAAAREVRAQIEQRTDANRRALSDAERRVEAAARAVLWAEMRPAMHAAIAEMETAERRVLDLGGALQFLAFHAAPRPPYEDNSDAHRLQFAGREIEQQPKYWPCAKKPGSTSPTADRWRAFRDALKADAATKLPK